MRRAWAVGLVAFALLPVGCGADDAVRETVDPIAEAADRTTAAGGARLEGRIVYAFEGNTVPATLRGVVDFAQERSRMRLEIPSLDRQEARESGFPHDEIHDGATVYFSTPQLRERLGAAWGKFDAERLVEEAREQANVDVEIDLEALSAWDESNPADLLRFLESAGGAKAVGEDRIDGVPVTRYEATVDLRRYAELAVPEDGEEHEAVRAGVLAGLRRQLGADRIPLEVALDRDGLIRREQFVLRMTIDGTPMEATVRLRFRDFGRHHQVELPAEDDVEDITDRLDEFRTELFG